ncbi:MlaD family protein [Mycolicibacillus trivialis]|uniref:MlaD family protein n=1 Tax=Mycolicibacillus trivialis TaxID=1798 RepID=UPI0021F3565C|nr:MlaD family protein [Mycolicibacillus trivialis]
MKFNPGITLLILVTMALAGSGYMAIGVLDLKPTKPRTRVTLMLDTSGGLLQTSQVTMRGVAVGRVTGIRTRPDGLAVSIDLDAEHPVPADSAITVQNLSVAGEQFIDFAPAVIAPPYLADGVVIPADRVAPTVTVSALLAKLEALFAALNPDDLHTIVSNVAASLTDNDDTLDALATTSRLFAGMVHDDREQLGTMFDNLSTLTAGMDALNVKEAFNRTGTSLPSAVPAFVRLIHSFEEISYVGQGLGSDQPVAELVTKIDQYLGDLSGPLGTFATVLQPVTAPLRDVKVDSGHWLDFWESTFNDSGGLRVHLSVPEWHQP